MWGDPDVEGEPRETRHSGKWAGLSDHQPRVDSVSTGVAVDKLKEIGNGSVAVPANFEVHPRLLKR